MKQDLAAQSNENVRTKAELDKITGDVNRLNETVEQNKVKENEIKKSKLSLQKKTIYLNKKVFEMKEKHSSAVENAEFEILKLKSELMQKEKEIEDLQIANDFLESDAVCTFADGKYTNEVRECVMTLMTTCNVSMSKMKDVITTVLSKLGGKQPTRLPSKALMSRLMVESKVLAAKHVASELIAKSNVTNLEGNCLHSDGTTKQFKHYEGFQVTLPNKCTMSLGLKEVGGGDAKTLLDSFKDTISDLADAITSDFDGKNELIGKLTVSILTMMTDGAAVNHAFLNEFELFRNTLLPAVVQNMDTLPPDTHSEIKSVSHFLCKMHPLVNFASSCDETLKMFEKNVVTGKNPFSFDKGESGTIRLIRTAAKSLTQRGSDKAGVHSHWVSYLHEKNKSDHLISFIGSRFNVVFQEAASVYFHKDDICDFYDKFLNPNLLSKSVQFDVEQKLFIAGTRALGIISKTITEPYECLVNKLPNIMSINPYLNEMRLALEVYSDDGSELLTGQGQIFSETFDNDDEISKKLFEDTNDPTLDTYTQMCLELL